jgi:hypothetical protein
MGQRPLIIKDGQIRELPLGDTIEDIFIITSNTTLTIDQSCSVISNDGAIVRLDVTLPPADTLGIKFIFVDDSGFGFNILADDSGSPADIIAYGSSVGTELRSAEQNGTVELKVTKLGKYNSFNSLGQWITPT